MIGTRDQGLGTRGCCSKNAIAYEIYRDTSNTNPHSPMRQSRTPTPYSLKPQSLLIPLLLLFLAISCRTSQHLPDTALLETGYLPLDAGASVYAVIDVPNARPILNHMAFGATNNRQFAQMLDGAHFAAAAAYLPGSGRRFQLYAQGNFPTGGAKMFFGLDKNWKKARSVQSGETYWYSKQVGLSVSLEPQRAFIAAVDSGEPPSDPFAGPGMKVPDGFDEFGKGSIFSFWMEKPDEIITGKLQEMGLPLEFPAEQVFFCFFPEAEGAAADGNPEYAASIRIQFSGEAQARAFSTIMGFAGGFVSRDTAAAEAMLASLLFSNPPVQDGRNLNIRTNTMSAREISLLFSLFSL